MKNPLEVSHRYDDIIDLPHYTSPIRPRMPEVWMPMTLPSSM